MAFQMRRDYVEEAVEGVESRFRPKP